MEINCKIKSNLGFQVQHYGGGVVSIHTEYYNKYDLTQEFLTVLAELKENNPKLKVTTILFVDEHPQAKRTYKELIVNFEEKQA